MQKITDFKKIIKSEELDSFIVTNPVNIFYLTGFRGISETERESVLVYAKNKFTLITAKLYINEARQVESQELKIKIASERNEIDEFYIDLLKTSQKTGFEEHDLKYKEYKELKKILPKVKLVPCESRVESLRAEKDDNEIRKIEKAQIISQNSLTELIKTLRAGQTEEEIAERLKKIMILKGADTLAFPSIVASGKNSAIPHHLTSKNKIKNGQALLFDFGAKYKNYCADLSRTVFLGKPSTRQRNVYENVENAQKAALEKITHGIEAHIAYHAANDIFRDNKLDEYFIHGLGHGIGLEVHEKPYLRKHGDDVLNEGMVFSVEPGLYLNWGGVRIEDLVVIINSRAKILGKKSEFVQIKI